MLLVKKVSLEPCCGAYATTAGAKFFSTAVGSSLKEEVMVKAFSGSVIRRECVVGLDPEVVCDVRLKSLIGHRCTSNHQTTVENEAGFRLG